MPNALPQELIDTMPLTATALNNFYNRVFQNSVATPIINAQNPTGVDDQILQTGPGQSIRFTGGIPTQSMGIGHTMGIDDHAYNTYQSNFINITPPEIQPPRKINAKRVNGVNVIEMDLHFKVVK